MKRVVVNTAVQETANIIREDILSRETTEGQVYLGSEDELAGRLGISRATLRQATRVLEQEQLVVVRRGNGGGIFGRQPSGEGVAHMASVFLRANGTSYGELIRCQIALGTACAQLAVDHGTTEGKERLVAYYKRKLDDGATPPLGGKEFVPIAGGFQIELARLAGSLPLRLFVEVLMELALPVGAIVLDDPERIQMTMRRHEAVAVAILEGNSVLAAERMRQHLETLLTWTDESLRIQTLPPLNP